MRSRGISAPTRRARVAALAWLVLCALLPVPAAASWAFCDAKAAPSAADKDRLLRFAAIVKGELERSGAHVALVARSGLDLSRVAQRYSHAGIALRASPETPWAVRQLYYACDEQVPRLYDQGMSAFLMGTDDARIGYISLVLLPEAPAAALERAALDNRLALRLLGAEYSANAYAFSPRYQNCNQWVAELLGMAWGDTPAGDDARARAQAWLRGAGYEAHAFHVPFAPMMWLVAAIPWLHHIDHPSEDLAQAVYRVSMPSAIEAFVQRRWPQARRVEFCQKGTRVVVRQGWTPIAEGCTPEPGDRVLTLD